MARISLNRRLFGEGYSGSVKLDVPAGGLSWMDSEALRSTAASAWQTSVETQRARQALERLDYTTGEVADTVDRMESALGLRIEAQTRVIAQQSEILQEIRGAVLNPAKTRAAERIADASQLLDAERFDRALAVSREAIEADPTNPNGFFAAGWSLVGRGELEEARAMFEEARDASQGDQRSLGCRQAARSAFLCEKPDLAYRLIRDARQVAASEDEKAAVAYDVAVYALAAGDRETAAQSLESACQHDSQHAKRAILDPAFEQAADLRDRAAGILREWAERAATGRDALAQEVADLHDALPAPPSDTRAHSELGRRLRPQSDWRELRADLNRQLSELGQVAGGQVEQGTPLQAVVQDLDRAQQRTQELARRALPRLAKTITAHDEAARRHDELALQRRQLQATRGQWSWLVSLRHTMRPKYGRYVMGGIVLSFFGLVLMSLLLLPGVALLLVVALAAVGGGIAEQKCDAVDCETRDLDEQLRTETE